MSRGLVREITEKNPIMIADDDFAEKRDQNLPRRSETKLSHKFKTKANENPDFLRNERINRHQLTS